MGTSRCYPTGDPDVTCAGMQQNPQGVADIAGAEKVRCSTHFLSWCACDLLHPPLFCNSYHIRAID